ncbi:MAG: hypothetical protein ACRDV7_08370 [Acidimicrobiia bacterium]
MNEFQAQNVAVVHRGLASDPDAVTDDVSWHFLSPLPDLVSHYEGRHQAMVEVPQMLADLTAGTFSTCGRSGVTSPSHTSRSK